MADPLKTPATLARLPFKYLSGEISMDLVNTVDWTRRGAANERLTNYEQLTRWAEGAGLVPSEHGKGLRISAQARPRAAQAALERARRLRTILQSLYRSVAVGAPQASAWENFNRELAGALGRLRVGPQWTGRKRVQAGWTWHIPEGGLDSFLWPIAWSAARLLTSDEAAHIRVCAGADCGWTYVDRSRNGLRRWCAMETCGTSEKTRRRRERRQTKPRP